MWGSNGSKKKINQVYWEYLGKSKREGSLDFKDLYAFNKALLAKQLQRILKNSDSLWACLLKSLYFPENELFSPKIRKNSSQAQKSIQKCKDLLSKGLRWQLSLGENINIWLDPWILACKNFNISQILPLRFL